MAENIHSFFDLQFSQEVIHFTMNFSQFWT